MTENPRSRPTLGRLARWPGTARKVNPCHVASRRATDRTDDILRWIDAAQAANRSLYGNMLAGVAILVVVLALAAATGLLPR